MQIQALSPQHAPAPRFGKLNRQQIRLLEDIKSGDEAALKQVDQMVAEARQRVKTSAAPDSRFGIFSDTMSMFERVMANKYSQVNQMNVLDREVDALKYSDEYSPSITALPFVALAARMKELLYPTPDPLTVPQASQSTITEAQPPQAQDSIEVDPLDSDSYSAPV